MHTTILESADDLQWLFEVHGIDARNCKIVYLYGNEDAPDRVLAYLVNDYLCEPIEYIQNEAGELEPLQRAGM